MQKKRNFSNEELEAVEIKCRDPRKPNILKGFKIFSYCYSGDPKKIKKYQHSYFFNESVLLTKAPLNFWEEKNKVTTLEIKEHAQSENLNVDYDLEDALKFFDRRIQHYKWIKKVLRESKFFKKRKKMQNKRTGLEIANERLIKALKMKDLGFNYKYISINTGLSISLIKNSVYKRTLEINPFLKGKGAPLKLKPIHLDFLLSTLKNGINNKPILFYKDLLEHLVKRFDDLKSEPPSISTVIKFIKKLGYSRKKGSKRFINSNSEHIKLERKKLVFKILNLEKCNKEFIYIDETRFNDDMTFNRGISKKNTKFLLIGKNKGQGITAICAISRRKIIGLQLFKGPVSGKDFGCFLINLINFNKDIKADLDKYYFFMDNAKIHKCKILFSFLENLNIIYNAPYSCDLNPIENVFGIVKQIFRNLNGSSDEKIENKIFKSFQSLSNINIEWIIQHSYTFY